MFAITVHADCPLHGAKSLNFSCAGAPNSCEVRPCFIGTHPKDCQTQRYSNYGIESCKEWIPLVTEEDSDAEEKITKDIIVNT